MGRLRGGLTTKIHALVDARGLPIALKLTPGQAHDGASAADMLTTLGKDDVLLADRAYNSDALRAKMAACGAWANIKPMLFTDERSTLSPRMCSILRQLWEEWRGLDTDITAVTKEVEAIVATDADCRRLLAIPGVGPLVATALVAAVADIPCLRHSSVTTAPASASLRIPMICSSMKLLLLQPSVPSKGLVSRFRWMKKREPRHNLSKVMLWPNERTTVEGKPKRADRSI